MEPELSNKQHDGREKARQIVVVGSSNVDFIMKMPHLPQRGETVTDATFLQTFGGKGANQAVAAARAGGDVHFVNCVGDDRYGAAIIENLQAAGVNTDFVFTAAGVASGTALVMVGDRGDNYLSVAPGGELPADLRPHRAGPSTDQPCRDDRAPVRDSHRNAGVRPGTGRPAAPPDPAEPGPARKVSEAGLRNVAYLVVNESEAEFLCGFPVDSLPRAVQAAESLRTRGPRAVLITLGSQGVCVACGGPPTHVPAFNVTAVDATAAGDVFCGVLAVALVENRPLEQAVRFASAAAAICVTRLGAQPSIPSRHEIDHFLHEQ